MLDWAEHLPWVLLGLWAAPKEDSAVSSAELVLGSQLVPPGQFLDTPDWPLQDLGRVRQQMTAASGGLPTRPLRGSRLRGACVADSGKSFKLIVCKSPGTNKENPGDAFMTLFASLT